MIKADYPNRFTELDQVNSYLHQLAEKINLNFANTTAEAIWRDTEKALSVLSDKETSAKEKADILASYSAMRSLIIKTAEYTVENSEKIKLSMSGDYVAKSEFGDYFEKATVEIEGTPVGITQLYGYTSGITGEFGDITVDSHNFIKTGLLYYDENSLPVYGVGVGELATKVDANGYTVLDRSNLLATYTADEIAFWQNSEKVAYINNGALYMPAANITGGTLNINDKFTVDILGNMKAENADITGKVKCTVLDCTNATVKGLVVGENITMGEGAVISWSNVNNKPDNLATTDDIPTNTSELTNDSGFAYTSDIPNTSNFIRKYGTYITDTAIWSGSLTANDLTITGGSVNISTGAKTENLIQLNYDYDSTTHAYTRVAPLGLTIYDDVGSVGSPATLTIQSAYISIEAAGGGVYIYTNEGHEGIVQADEFYLGNLSFYSVFASRSDLSSYALSSHTHSQYYESGDNIYANKLYVSNAGNISGDPNARLAATSPYQLGYSSGSSMWYKHDIKPVENEDLDPHHLYDIKIYQFKYNDDYLNENDQRYGIDCIGFIAEQVNAVYPIAADRETGKPRNWEMRYIIPPMLALIQEHKKEIDALKERIDVLEN